MRHELKALLCARLCRSRESKTLPPRIGCCLLGSPSTGKDDRLRNYSRPGPKSGWEATSPLHSSYYRVSFPAV